MLVSGHDKKGILGAAIEFRLGKIYKQKKGKIDILQEKWPEVAEITLQKKGYELKPGEYILAKTMEKIN